MFSSLINFRIFWFIVFGLEKYISKCSISVHFEVSRNQLIIPLESFWIDFNVNSISNKNFYANITLLIIINQAFKYNKCDVTMLLFTLKWT